MDERINRWRGSSKHTARKNINKFPTVLFFSLKRRFWRGYLDPSVWRCGGGVWELSLFVCLFVCVFDFFLSCPVCICLSLSYPEYEALSLCLSPLHYKTNNKLLETSVPFKENKEKKKIQVPTPLDNRERRRGGGTIILSWAQAFFLSLSCATLVLTLVTSLLCFFCVQIVGSSVLLLSVICSLLLYSLFVCFILFLTLFYLFINRKWAVVGFSWFVSVGKFSVRAVWRRDSGDSYPLCCIIPRSTHRTYHCLLLLSISCRSTLEKVTENRATGSVGRWPSHRHEEEYVFSFSFRFFFF
eukprot:gene12340-8468_t